MQNMAALVVTVEEASGGYYRGWNVKLNGEKLWFKPYDGSDAQEVAHEVVATLCAMLRERTGHPADEPENDY